MTKIGKRRARIVKLTQLDGSEYFQIEVLFWKWGFIPTWKKAYESRYGTVMYDTIGKYFVTIWDALDALEKYDQQVSAMEQTKDDSRIIDKKVVIE